MFSKFVIVLKALFLSGFAVAITTEYHLDYEILNRNLFDGLKLHPKLNAELNVTEKENTFIDRYVDDYFKLTVDSLENKQGKRSRRGLNVPISFPNDEFGNYVFSGLSHFHRLPIYNAQKFEFFRQDDKWFLATMEKPKLGPINTTNLLIFRIENNTFSRVPSWIIHTVVEFSIHSAMEITYIIAKGSDDYFSGIWEFDGLKLLHAQNMEMENVTDFGIWETATETFMAMSGIGFRNQTLNLNETKNYNTTSVYKWEKYYFDRIQIIDQLANIVLGFTVEENNFLYLGIDKTRSGEYAEIYRYNLGAGQYEIHQRIPTFNCRDVKFFSMKNFDGYDSFLVVANYISGEDLNEIPPIIYKYVNGYFLPFQNLNIEGIIDFQTFYNPKNSLFLLLARTEFQGLKMYQYDGWIFQESSHDINSDLEGSKIKNAKFGMVEKNRTVLAVGLDEEVVEDKDGLDFYRIDFDYENEVADFRRETLKWCETSARQLTQSLRRKRQIDSGENETAEFTTEDLMGKIQTAIAMVDDLEQRTANSLQYDGPHIVQDLNADKIIMKDPFIRSLTTKTLNGVTVDDLLDNLINVNEDGQWPVGVVLERAQIDSQIYPKKINGKNIEDVISTNDNLSLKTLEVTGETKFEAPVITETLNKVPFDEEHILMKNGDQRIRRLDVDEVRVENLSLGTKKEKPPVDQDGLIRNISIVKADYLAIGGLINGVSIKTLDKYALRSSGDQIINAKYSFRELHVDKLEGPELNDQEIKNLVRVDSGKYTLRSTLEFQKPLAVNKLTIVHFLDAIRTKGGKLGVLLKDTEEMQYVTGTKVMNNVVILTSINLQGNMDGYEGERYNPTVHVEGPLIFEGNYSIIGDTTIEKLLLTSDIRSADGDHSVQRVLSQGILLKDKEIDVSLNFNQQLIVDEVFVDKINGVDPKTWVVTGSDEQQIIRGPKVFVNDVNITGNTDFFRINDILVSDLDSTILRKTGDQVITGKHTVTNIVTNKITGNNTLIGKNSWRDILTTDTEQIVTGTTVINADVVAQNTTADFANINGLINGFNFDKIVEDTVTIDSKRTITGEKTFKNLKAKDVNVANMDLKKKKKFTIEKDVELEKALVENVHFMKTCNGVEASKFGEQLSEENQLTITEVSDFEDLVVLGSVYIESNRLGNMDLEKFDRDTVKIDVEHEFGNVVVDNTLISNGPVTLQGEIEKVDLDNVIQSTSEDLLDVSGRKTFLNDLTVHGMVSMEGAMKNFDLAKMCDFADVNDDEKQLEIHGNAVFVKGPKVVNVANKSMKSIHENSWFRNREVDLKQDVSFEKITFRNNVTVNGTVDGVELEALEKEYFSITKDQGITGGLYFANDVIFEKNLVCPQVDMNGEVNGIKIQELPRTVLLQDMDQVFEEIAYFENVVVDDLQGEFTVNNLSLETDFMRYDKENMVTGKKRLNTLFVRDLELKPNTTLQNVDVLEWMQNAVLKKGTFAIEQRKIIDGNVRFDRPLSLLGSLNGEMFTNETIMLKSAPQKVTGLKRFELKPMEMMKFRNVKLKGLLNDMQMSDLLDDQSGSGDMILKSPMHFLSDINIKNINLKKPFRGVRMEEFLSGLEDLEKTDLVEKYAKLLNMTVRLNRKLRVQSFYLQSYKELQEIENPQYIINSCCGSPTLIYFDYINSSYVLYYYYWDQELGRFEKSVHLTVDLGYPPVKTEAFSLDRQQFLYMEYPSQEHSQEGMFRGQFWKVENLNRLIDYGSIISNGIRQITPLRVKESHCILVIYEYVKSPHIFCDFNLGQLRLMKPLSAGKYIRGEYLMIDGISFLVLLNSNEENTKISQAGVEIWCLHDEEFGIRQVLYFSDPPPQSISTVSYKGFHYLSVVYRGGIQQGHIDILRYSKLSGNFEQWQKITSSNLVKAEFSILPSGELFFFVLGPSNETLSIYKYVGVSGFKEEITIPSPTDIDNFKQFSLGNKHFVLVSNQDKVKILQAQFKGNTEESL